MNGSPLLLGRVLGDLGLYAMVLSLVSGGISLRANPRRSLNRFFFLLCLNITLYQFVVMMARTTGQPGIWAPFALPLGATSICLLFLIHDAVLWPNDSLKNRVTKRWINPVVNLALYSLAAGLTFRASHLNLTVEEDSVFPLYLRVFSSVAIVSFLYVFNISRPKSSDSNRFEIQLWNLLTVSMQAVFCVFILIRTPIGSRINSVIITLMMITALAYQCQDRVMDSRWIGRTALVWLGILLIHMGLDYASIWAIYHYTDDSPIAVITLTTIAINLGMFTLVHPRVSQRILGPALKSSDEARKSLSDSAAAATTEHTIISETELVCSKLLAGLPVSARVFFAKSDPDKGDTVLPVVTHGGDLATLADIAVGGQLSTFSALRVLRGERLDFALSTMKREKLGAVVRLKNHDILFAIFIGERGGGSRPISVFEMDRIGELAAIAMANIVRLRALNSSLRAQSHAVIGQMASHFNHESRNQIESIKMFLANLADPATRGMVSGKHIAMAQESCETLSDHYETVLGMAALRAPEKLVSIDANDAVHEFLHYYRDVLSKNGVEVTFNEGAESAIIMADALTLRRVLINLSQNSIQAMNSVPSEVKRLTYTVLLDENSVHIRIEDNGPGIPPHIYDNIFSPWATSREGGSGLGLSSCKQWIQQMGGALTCFSQRGDTGAIFDLSFPRQSPVKAANLAHGTSTT